MSVTKEPSAPTSATAHALLLRTTTDGTHVGSSVSAGRSSFPPSSVMITKARPSSEVGVQPLPSRCRASPACRIDENRTVASPSVISRHEAAVSGTPSMLYAGVAVIQMPAMIETEVVSARTDVHSPLLCAIDRFVMPAVFPLVAIFSNKPRIPAQSNHVSVRVTIGHTTHLIIVGARHNCEQQANSWKCAKKLIFRQFY